MSLDRSPHSHSSQQISNTASPFSPVGPRRFSRPVFMAATENGRYKTWKMTPSGSCIFQPCDCSVIFSSCKFSAPVFTILFFPGNAPRCSVAHRANTVKKTSLICRHWLARFRLNLLSPSVTFGDNLRRLIFIINAIIARLMLSSTTK